MQSYRVVHRDPAPSAEGAWEVYERKCKEKIKPGKPNMNMRKGKVWLKRSIGPRKLLVTSDADV